MSAYELHKLKTYFSFILYFLDIKIIIVPTNNDTHEQVMTVKRKKK